MMNEPIYKLTDKGLVKDLRSLNEDYFVGQKRSVE